MEDAEGAPTRTAGGGDSRSHDGGAEEAGVAATEWPLWAAVESDEAAVGGLFGG